MTHTVTSIDVADFNSMIVQFLLFKLGGQMTFSIAELQRITSEFGYIKITRDPTTGEITLTTKAIVSDSLYNAMG